MKDLRDITESDFVEAFRVLAEKFSSKGGYSPIIIMNSRLGNHLLRVREKVDSNVKFIDETTGFESIVDGQNIIFDRDDEFEGVEGYQTISDDVKPFKILYHSIEYLDLMPDDLIGVIPSVAAPDPFTNLTGIYVRVPIPSFHKETWAFSQALKNAMPESGIFEFETISYYRM